MSDTVKILCANNAFGSLASALASTDKTLILSGDQGDKFPFIETGSSAFYATLEDADGNLEIVLVTSRLQSTLTVTRGQCGALAGLAGLMGERATEVVFAQLRQRGLWG